MGGRKTTPLSREKRDERRKKRKPLPPGTEPVWTTRKDGVRSNIAGLKRYPKGVSGNPKGRTPSKTLSQAYRERLNEVDPNDEQGRTYMDIIADTIVAKAVQGIIDAAKELADRTEGKAAQTFAMSLAGRLEGPSAPPTLNVQFVTKEQAEAQFNTKFLPGEEVTQ